MTPPILSYSAIAPVALVAVGAMVVLMGEVFLSGRESLLGRRMTRSFLGSILALVSALFLLVALITTWQSFDIGAIAVFNEGNPLVRLDRLASFSITLIAVASLLNENTPAALAMVFLGLEIMSIPIYVLAGFDRRRLRSNESALKYFLVGSFASALLLYGMALLYGVTGHTDFEGIRAALLGAEEIPKLGLVGLGLVLVGFTFKISSVPFHQWTPDVYEGAPTSVTAYMSVTVKVAAFAALLRLLVTAFGDVETGISDVLWVLAALTMVIGNFLAIVQDNVKRMLAYSSIAHAGYILVGFVTATQEAFAAVLFYLLVYVFMNLGAFAVIVALAHRGRDADRFEDFAGLAKSRPAMAAVMTLFMIALAGIPGTGGFIAKFALFSAAVRADVVGLTIIAVLTSVVSVFYYLRLPVVMYMREPGEEAPRAELASGEWVVLAVCGFVVLLLGVFPNAAPTAALSWFRALDWSRQSIALLF